MATRSRPSAFSTALQTSMPIRPRAPSTPTRIGSSSVTRTNYSAAGPRPGPGPRSHPRPPRSRPQPPRSVAADEGQVAGRAEHLVGDRRNVLDGDALDAPQQLVDVQQIAEEQLALGQPGHPRSGVLQP